MRWMLRWAMLPLVCFLAVGAVPPVAGAADQPSAASDCTLPPAGAARRLVAFGMYQGHAYSTVTVAGQGGPTTVADIDIEGSEPVYLLAVSFESAILRITGPVERLVLATEAGNGGRGIGATGVPADRVSFLPMDCFGLHRASLWHPQAQPRATVVAIAEAVGIAAVDVAATEHARGARIFPGGAEVIGSDKGWRGPSETPPVEIAASAVVANVPVEVYRAYPGDLGLDRARAAKVIVGAPRSDFEAWIVGYIARPDVDIETLAEARQMKGNYSGSFKVLAATTLPAPNPLYNAYFWLVPAGVPVPEDALGDEQCIFIMDGFTFAGPADCPNWLTFRSH